MNDNAFSVLDRYGTDVTKEEYITNPAIGREQQIKELILILLTPEKSAILIGKPGIGKTAIVEGLAWRLQKEDVPEALKGYTIINIKTASLLGTMPDGESKVQIMIDELKTKDKIILFVDEVHMLIGATDSSSLDFANIFKEGLGRGSIKVIGATTTEEYERYILRDKAFTRRFQKVEVPEPTPEEVVEIMMGTLPKIEKTTGRKMKYTKFQQSQIMKFVVFMTDEYKRVYAIGSRYPDISLTIMKQAFSYAVFDNREWVDIFDFKKAIENSKNIYPDVIRKNMPSFDVQFKDIIAVEKGEVTELDIHLGRAVKEDIKEEVEIEEPKEEIKVEEPKEEIKVEEPKEEIKVEEELPDYNPYDKTTITNNFLNSRKESIKLSNFSNGIALQVPEEKKISSNKLDNDILTTGINVLTKRAVIESPMIEEKVVKQQEIKTPTFDSLPDIKENKGWTFIQSIDNKNIDVSNHKNIEATQELKLDELNDNKFDDFFDNKD